VTRGVSRQIEEFTSERSGIESRIYQRLARHAGNYRAFNYNVAGERMARHQAPEIIEELIPFTFVIFWNAVRNRTAVRSREFVVEMKRSRIERPIS